jgi:DNA-binding NarL/FixJ family response regulator
MPVLDGGETASAMQLRNPRVPILIMSGLADHAALHGLGEARIAGFVPKPFAPDQLAQAVALARQGAAKWVGKDRREEREPSYAGPERREGAGELD